ncbi:DUF4238 domain-containing protein [Alkalihalobacillus sp. AL-G]|uniref:DUF4238 domain-containing protein n=1 Tax=Alkalihalobacillus sp. AL-G TaxID=2926399 RepID=UPI00272D39B8|nr:DUF4238 domain-containing protein [Alkalihalobacillus sp. AL-G]WLD94625.1 DUF4238 domain-containing protein [Alkalihalobacillus sp. AL-G]
MGKTKKKHHYVPKSLLAGFTKKETVESPLWVFDQETGKQWESKPVRVGFKNDIYKIEIADVLPDALEDSFMEIETKTAPIIKKLKNTLEMPKGTDFIWLINYIALQYSRTPVRKETLSEPMANIAKIMMQMSIATPERYTKLIEDMKKDGKNIGEELSYKEMHDFIMDEDRYKIVIDNNTKMNNILTSIDAIIPTLMKRNWSVVYSPTTVGDFICSDNPVNLHWTNPQLNRGFFNSPGHGLPDTEVSFPLSSRVMLLGRFDNFQPSSGTIPNKLTLAALNSFTGKQADRFIYSRKKDFYWLSNDNKVANIEDFKSMIREKNC